MQAFTHSAFLQALGYAIAHSLWQVALMWGAVSFVNSVFKFTSTVKYHIALTAELISFCWFIFTFSFYYQRSAEAFAAIQSLRSEDVQAVMLSPQQQNFSSWIFTALVRVEQTLPYLSSAYLLLFIILLARWIRTYSYTRNIQTNGLEKIDVEWKLFVKKMSDRLNIKQEIQIYISHLVTSPLTIGFIKPVILIPLASINNLSPEQMEAVILHELAHIKRFDYLVNLILSVVELALFFNPFMQLISRTIKKERENSCDDWVLQFQYQPAMYAEALLRIAYLQNGSLLAMHAVNNKQELLVRVKRMVNKKEKFNYKQQLIALFILTGIFCSVAWFQPSSSNHSSKIKRMQGVYIEPLATKVSNPLMNPFFFLAKPLNEEIKKAEVASRKHLAQAEIARPLINLELPSVPPSAIDQLKQINAEKFKHDLQKAGQQAWKEFKNEKFRFSPGFFPVDFDSSFLVENIKHAYAGIDTKKMNEGIQKAKEQMKNLKMPGFAMPAEVELNRQLNKLLNDLPSIAVLNTLPEDVQIKISDAMEKLELLREGSGHLPRPPMKMRLDSIKRIPTLVKRNEDQEIINNFIEITQADDDIVLVRPEPQDKNISMVAPRIALARAKEEMGKAELKTFLPFVQSLHARRSKDSRNENGMKKPGLAN